jgi:hypothetical protein
VREGFEVPFSFRLRSLFHRRSSLPGYPARRELRFGHRASLPDLMRAIVCPVRAAPNQRMLSGPASLVYPADAPLAAEDAAIHVVFVEAGAEPARAHGEGHSDLLRLILCRIRQLALRAAMDRRGWFAAERGALSRQPILD